MNRLTHGPGCVKAPTIWAFLESVNEQQISILKFFVEQIDLAFSKKYSRKYSSDLLMIAYIIFATSPIAYERLVEEKILIFPSIKTLKAIYQDARSRCNSIIVFLQL